MHNPIIEGYTFSIMGVFLGVFFFLRQTDFCPQKYLFGYFSLSSCYTQPTAFICVLFSWLPFSQPMRFWLRSQKPQKSACSAFTDWFIYIFLYSQPPPLFLQSSIMPCHFPQCRPSWPRTWLDWQRCRPCCHCVQEPNLMSAYGT